MLHLEREFELVFEPNPRHPRMTTYWVPEQGPPERVRALLRCTPEARREATVRPRRMGRGRDGREYWLFRNRLYSTPATVDEDEAQALLLGAEDAVRSRLARAARVVRRLEVRESGPRKPLPDDVKLFVWNRDDGRCVRCGSNEALEFDHIIPIAMGGSSTARNVQLLCEPCNRTKGGALA